MDRLRRLLRPLSPERLTWFGAGLAAASLALVSYQVAFGALLTPTSPLPPRIEVATQIALITPTRTPWPTDTPRPSRTPWPTDTPRPTRTSWPTETPRPTRTPRDTPTPWPTRAPLRVATPVRARTPTPAPEQAFTSDVATFAERLTDLAAAMATASARLACRTPTPSGAPEPCG